MRNYKMDLIAKALENENAPDLIDIFPTEGVYHAILQAAKVAKLELKTRWMRDNSYCIENITLDEAHALTLELTVLRFSDDFDRGTKGRMTAAYKLLTLNIGSAQGRNKRIAEDARKRLAEILADATTTYSVDDFVVTFKEDECGNVGRIGVEAKAADGYTLRFDVTTRLAVWPNGEIVTTFWVDDTFQRDAANAATTVDEIRAIVQRKIAARLEWEQRHEAEENAKWVEFAARFSVTA